MYKVVLVDDERLILEGLSRVIPWAKMGCTVVGTASNGQEGLALIREQQPDIVLTDVRMPNMDGLAMLAALRLQYPRMQMSVLTASRDFDYAQQAIRLGVCRYLLKPSKMDEINEAILTMVSHLTPQAQAAEENPEEEEPTDEASAAGSFVVQEALRYMKAHCTEHLTLSMVADAVYVSQWHLSKLINRYTGQSFFDLLGTMRIERAKLLLTDPAMRVHDVAAMVGYNDVAHFSKSFKKITGLKPVEYRASLAKENNP